MPGPGAGRGSSAIPDTSRSMMVLSRTVRNRARVGDDRGATAVITAVLVSLLFGVAALAVDLGNAYARDARIDAIADQAAVAAARALPDPCAALDAAVEILLAEGNAVRDDSGEFPSTAAGLATALSDDEVTNGEVVVTGPDGVAVPASDCTAVGTRVRVVTPPIQVSFGLAAAAGFRSVDVRGAATTAMVSPLPVLPFAIPAECAAEPVRTFMVNPPATSPTVSPVPVDHIFSPPSVDDPAGLAVVAPPLVDTVAGTITVTVDALSSPGTWTWRVEMSGDGIPPVLSDADPPVADGFPPGGTGSITAPLPRGAAAGTWTLRVGREDPSGLADPVWSAATTVVVPGTPATATTCSRPDVFGDVLLLDTGVPLTVAITDGLPGPFRAGDLVRAAGLANQASEETAVSEALLDRLSRAGPVCDADRGDWSVAGRTITATNALACYNVDTTGLTPFTLASPEILDDPRVFLVPVVASPLGTTDPPFPSGVQDMTVTDHRVAIITDEVPDDITAGVPVGECTVPATDTCTGVRVDGSAVRSITLLLLDPATLVPDLTSGSPRPGSVRLDDNGYAWVTDDGGGPRDVHLVE